MKSIRTEAMEPPAPGARGVSGVHVAHPGDVAIQESDGALGDASPNSTLPARRARARVLLVEDDVTALAVSARALSRIGYAVTACLEASEGAQLVRTNPHTFDVVVANTKAGPTLGGLRLPLVLTAYKSEPRSGADIKHAYELQKPFTALELSDAIDVARAEFDE